MSNKITSTGKTTYVAKVTSSDQTTFVKTVKIGIPIKSVNIDAGDINALSNVDAVNAKHYNILVYDSDVSKWVNADSANLVNLTLTGNVKSNLVPSQDSSFDLGDSDFKWKDLYLSGGTLHLGGLDIKDSSTGLSVTDSVGNPVNFSLLGSRSQIRGFFGAGGDLSYDASTGIFSFDVEEVYTKANFDSDLGAALDGGTGITYDSSTDTISITNTGVTAAEYGSATSIPKITVNAQGQITSASNIAVAGVTSVAFDSASQNFTISTADGGSFVKMISNRMPNTDSGVYGTAVKIPVLTINKYGQIDSAGTVSVAGVSSTSFDSGTGLFTINTADGNSFSTHIQDSADLVRISRASLSANNVSGDGSLAYNNSTGVFSYTGPSASNVRAHLSANKGLTYNSTSGEFNIDSANVKGMFSGDKGLAYNSTTGVFNIDSSNVRGMFSGDKGLTYNSATGVFDIDSANVKGMLSGGTGISYNSSTGEITSTDADIVHDNLFGFEANEHIDHTTVSVIAGKGLLGGGTIDANRTIDIDSSNVRGMFSGSNSLDYNSSTGDIRAPQPLDSSANPTFNQLRGPATFIIDPAAVGDATGTVRVLGNLTVEGTTTTINSTNVSVNDKTFTLADSAPDSAGLNGGGIIWGGSFITANKPSFTYNHAQARFDANRPISADSFIGDISGNVIGTIQTAVQPNIDHDQLANFEANEHVDHTSVSVIAGKGLLGGGTIDANRTIDIDSANVRGMFSGGTGVTYTSGTGEIKLTNTGVTADAYGSATLIPQITVNEQGQITSVSTTAVAGVSSTSFDSSTGIFTINTADGNSFTTHIQDSADLVRISRASLSVSNASGDGSLAYNNSTGAFTYTGPSAEEVRAHFTANKGLSLTSGEFNIDSANVRAMFAGNKGLAYNSGTGVFDIDSANVRGMFSGGTGITYTSATGAITTTDAEIVHDNLFGFEADEHVDHTTVSVIAGKGLLGGGTIASNRTINVDSDNIKSFTVQHLGTDFVDSAEGRKLISGNKGLTYNSSTGVFDVDSANIQSFTVQHLGTDFVDSAEARKLISGNKGLTYNSSTGVFNVDSTNIQSFTVQHLGTDFVDSAEARKLVTGNKGLTYNSTTGVFDIDSANVRGMFSGDKGLTYNSATGVFDIDSANIQSFTVQHLGTDFVDSAEGRKLISGNKGLTYNSNTGVFNVDSTNIQSFTVQHLGTDFVDSSEARKLISGDKGLTYNSTTGVFDVDSSNIQSFTVQHLGTDFVDSAEARKLISITFTGGDGAASYNPGTGVFTYTGPSAEEVRAHFTANKGLSLTSGEFNIDSANVKGMFSGDKGLAYNSSTGVFDIDSANVREMFSGVSGIKYNSGTGAFSADSAAALITSGTIDSARLPTIPADFVNVSKNNSGSTEVHLVFADSIGSQGIELDSDLTYNPQIGVLGLKKGNDTIRLQPGGAGISRIIGGQDTLALRSSETGDVTLSYGNQVKLRTTDSGVNVGQNIIAGGTITGTIVDSDNIKSFTVQHLGTDFVDSSEARKLISGDKGLTYNSTTGVFDIDSANIRGFTVADAINDGTTNIAPSQNAVFDALASKLDASAVPTLGNDFVDSDQVNILIDARDTHDSAAVQGQIDSAVDADFINALTIDADTLGGQDGSYYLNYNNFTNTPTIPTLGGSFVDSSEARKVLSGSNSIDYNSSTGDIRAPQPLDSSANPTFNQLRGPATFVIDPATIGDATGTVQILGNLQVDGTTTTINSTDVTIDDKTFTLADNAADSSALNGGGIIWGGSSIVNKPSFTYNHAQARFDVNRSIAIDSANAFLLDVSGKQFKFGDNYKATFGTGNDLQIFHNGSLSHVRDAGTGELRLSTNGDQIRMYDTSGNRTIAQFLTGFGSVALWYNNSKKFETINTGATVTGTMNADSATFTNITGTIQTAVQPNIDHDQLTNFQANEHVDHTGVSVIAGKGLLGGGTIDANLTLNVDSDNIKSFTVQHLGTDFVDSAEARKLVSGNKGLTYNSSTGVFDVDSANIQSFIIIDEDDFSTNSATKAPSQQSTKEYIAAQIAGAASGDITSVIAGKGLLGGATSGDATINVDSDNIKSFTVQHLGTDFVDSAEARKLVSGNKGLTYNSSTGVFDVDSANIQSFMPKLGTDFVDSDEVNILIDARDTHDSAAVQGQIDSSLDNLASLTVTGEIDARGGITDNGGSLILQASNGNGIRLRNHSGDDLVSITNAGAAQLKHSGNTKLTTTDYGITVTGTMNADSATLSGRLRMSNNTISGVNKLEFSDPGPNEGLQFGGNTKIYESPNNLTTNSAGNLQFVFNDTRRMTVDTYGAEIVGRLDVDSATISGGSIFFDSASNSDRLQLTHALRQSSDVLQIQTSSGHVRIGPQNTGFAHFETDRAKFYFNERIMIGENRLTSYNGDLELQNQEVTKLTLTDSGAKVTGQLVADSATISGPLTADSSTIGTISLGISTAGQAAIEKNGSLNIRGNWIRLQKPNSTEDMLVAKPDGEVELYHNGNQKLETTAYGVTVTGTVNADSASISGPAVIGGNGSTGGVTISDGLIDIRSGTGNVSKIKFYCETSNAHFQTLQAAPHDNASSAVLVLPDSSGTLALKSHIVDSAAISSIITADVDQAFVNALNVDAETLDGINSTAFLRSNAADVKTSGNLTFNDDIKAYFGTGSDLEIFHSSAINRIQATGLLYIKGTDINFYKTGTSELMASFQEDSSVSLYYDAVKKFETTDSGVLVTGQLVADSATFTNATFTGDVAFDSALAVLFDKSDQSLKFGDNYRAKFGASNDLQIFHNGASSVINDTGTGKLTIGASDRIDLMNPAATEYMARFHQDSSVELYHDNSKKFETTDSGATVTGLLVADSATLTNLTLSTGTSVNEFSIDGSLGGNSDNAVPTEKAVKTYVDAEVAGAGGGGVTVQDEGGALSTTATTLNFVGSGVEATGTGATKTITISGGGGGGGSFASYTSGATLAASVTALANTSSGGFTLTLPASPSANDQIIILDAGGTFGTNNLTVGRNGNTIQGNASDLVCDIDNVAIRLHYTGSDWRVYAITGTVDGNAVTLTGSQTLTNKTLTNPSINNYTEGTVAIGNTGTSHTFDITSGTFQTATLNGNCTFTMPTVATGKSFVLKLSQGGSFTAAFTSVKFAGGTAPTITTGAGKIDIISFISDGTSWYGSAIQDMS